MERIDTGILDTNCKHIFTGDKVKLFNQTGTVVMECGAYGIAMDTYIDWDYLEEQIKPVTGCNNLPDFCYHDFFISFWELLWNYNSEENLCDVVEIIGKEKQNES